jgi:hypothetical protein
VVYLVTVPFGDKSAQKVFPGVVIGRTADNQVQYNVDGAFKTTGSSGAPVIDEFGRLAGVNVAHLDDQNIPGKMQLICIDSASVLAAVKLPADVKPVDTKPAAVKPAPVASPTAAATTRPAVGSPPAATPTDNPADAALRSAKLFMDNTIYDKAKTKLQAIIDTYPDSDAAKQAKDLLSQIPDTTDSAEQ